MTTFRIPSDENLFFRGRPGDPRLGESIKRLSTETNPPPQSLVLWGCPDDTGVTLNRGRAGAKEGPNAIRKHFFKMAPPIDRDPVEIWDAGNLVPSKEDIVETQKRCESTVSELAKSGATLLALGGGHDFAAPNFLGWVAAHEPGTRFGLINVDPHLDVRELEEHRPHSGTPFRQILESRKILPKDFVEFGYRKNRNAKTHLRYCEEQGVDLVSFEELIDKSIVRSFEKKLKKICAKCDRVAVTIDMDSCKDTEGTSAAPVIGFSAQDLCLISQLCGEASNVTLFEIAEVAPPLDPSERGARIAAECLFHFLYGRASSFRKPRSKKLGKAKKHK